VPEIPGYDFLHYHFLGDSKQILVFIHHLLEIKTRLFHLDLV